MPDLHRAFDPIPLHAWLIDAGLSGMPAQALFDGFCRRLTASGFSLARGLLSFATLHPLRRANSITWQSGGVVEATDFNYAQMATPAWHASPFRHMLENRV